MSQLSKFRQRTSCLSSLTLSLSGISSSDGGGDPPLLFLLPLPMVRCLGRAGWPGTLTYAGGSHELTSLHTASTGFWVRERAEEVCRSRELHGSLEERLRANKDDQVDLLLASTCSSVMIALPRLAAQCRACRDAGGVRWRPSWRDIPVNSCLTTSIHVRLARLLFSHLPSLAKSRLHLFFFAFGAKAW